VKALVDFAAAPHSNAMTPASGRVLILGGNSSIARHLLALLPDARAIGRRDARIEPAPRTAVIDDYRDLRPADFAGAQAVINCAGIVSGSEAALQAINVDLQAALARTAREAGVQRYVAIGSFSIFGRCTRIEHDTSPAPANSYGRSKLQGEWALRALETDRFATVSIAFPAIIGTTRLGKVERMVRLWRRAGIWPVPSRDIARSMIGAYGAARVLASAAGGDQTGRVLAADPTVFTYSAVAQWLRDDLGGRFAQVHIPALGVALLQRAGPSLHHSIMADSLLEPGSNYMLERGIDSSLRRELVDAVRENHQ
jgi:nucleoside-diphosphate-sugar epimerase